MVAKNKNLYKNLFFCVVGCVFCVMLFSGADAASGRVAVSRGKVSTGTRMPVAGKVVTQNISAATNTTATATTTTVATTTTNTTTSGNKASDAEPVQDFIVENKSAPPYANREA